MAQYSKISIEEVISKSFKVWWRNIDYLILYSLLYISILGGILYALSFTFNIWYWAEEIQKRIQGIPDIQKKTVILSEQLEKLQSMPDFQQFIWGTSLALIILSPLALGLYEVFRKRDSGIKPEFTDLFSGYSGNRTFSILALFGVVNIINALLPYFFINVFVIYATLTCSALIFFKNINVFQALQLSVRIAFSYPGISLIGILLCGILKYVGLFLFVVPILVTLPFWLCYIYSFYVHLEKEAAATKTLV